MKKARDRLANLIQVSAPEVAATKRSGELGGHYLDHPKYTAWRVSSLTAIKKLAPGSHFERDFESFDTAKGFNYPQRFEAQLAVLKALLDDLDGGHLANLRGLIRAEVFSDLLDQAQHLHDEGYWQPAAVVAGAVLEDHLRKLCLKHSITLSAKPKLDGMNAELAKAGEYDVLVQKRITLLADIRNKAAHGRWTEFTDVDAQDLIHSAVRFLADHPA